MKNKSGVPLFLTVLLFVLSGCIQTSVDMASNKNKEDAISSRTNNQVKEYQFIDFFMIDELVGWAFSESDLFKTEDGGETWNNVLLPELVIPPYVDQFSYHFIDREEGWIATTDLTEVYIFHTINGGQTWSKSIISEPGIFSLKLFFLNSNIGWLLGESEPAMSQSDKFVFKTNDGGQNWSLMSSSIIDNQSLPRVGYPTGISFNNESNGWVTYPFYINEYISVYYTNNGGEEWSLLQLKEPMEYRPEKNYYSSAYPPVFDTEDPNRGTLLLKMKLFM